MNRVALGLLLATFAGAAAAGDLSEPRYQDSNDYSALAYYRVDFGGTRGHAQSVGLRFDSVRAQAAGAPPMLQASFDGQGLNRLAVTGVDLRGAMLSANQSEGGFWASLTTTQMVALGLTVLTLGIVAADSADDEPSGTGGS